MVDLLKNHLKSRDQEKTIQFITDNPEVLNFEDENGTSGLLLVAYSGLNAAFKHSIQLAKSFSFHEAIVCGQQKSILACLDTSEVSLVNSHSNDGFTPLSLAAFFDRTEIAKLLLEKGADPNLSATNPSRVNALHSAVAKENLELCAVLIKFGVDVNARQTQNVTALHSAVHRGNLELTKLLVLNGAATDLTMDNGDTALLIAQKEGHKSVEQYLLTLK